MGKFKKIIVIVLFFTIVIAIFNTLVVNASTGSVEGFNGSFGSKATVTDSKEAIIKIVSTVLNLVRIAGITIAFTMLVVVACKYIIASAGDKADIKKYAFNYIVGALILFGSAGIVTIIRNFVLNSFTEESPLPPSGAGTIQPAVQ